MNTELSLWGYFVKCVTEKYCCFSGRARRKEFWGFVLFNFLVEVALAVVLTVLVDIEGAEGLLLVTYLVLLLPGLGAIVRRLHDTGRSGWWFLLAFVPFGALVLLVFYCLDSQPGANEYGPNPKELA